MQVKRRLGVINATTERERRGHKSRLGGDGWGHDPQAPAAMAWDTSEAQSAGSYLLEPMGDFTEASGLVLMMLSFFRGQGKL